MHTRNNRQIGQTRGPGGSGPLQGQAQIARIAELVARRNAAGVSLRELADQTGISKSAIDGLIKAHHRLRPMPSPHITRARLTKWYLQEKVVEDGGLQHPVDMAIVAQELLAGFPDADRPAAVAELVASLEGLYQRYGVGRPAWLAALARATDAPPRPGRE